jgi:hypothetical protein
MARWGFRLLVIAIGMLAFLPLADWIPAPPGTYLPPPLWPLFLFWSIGLLGIGFLGWILVKLIPGRPAPPATPPESVRDLFTGRWIPVFLLLLLPTAIISITALEVFDGRPLHIDAMTQAFQAQIFSHGRLSAPAPDDPPFFSSLMVVEHEGRTFSHFAPGWAALLAVGLLLGIPWIMAPLCAGLGVYGLYLLLREDGEGRGGAVFPALLLAASPWVVINGASWMNHVPAMSFAVLGSAALLRGIRRPESWVYSGVGAALLGYSTMIRPLEGVAFGLPATVWMLVRTWRDPSARRGLASFGVGGSLTIGLLLAYNWAQHGGPLTFGFDLQWGPGHGLGFHEAPWGPDHTPLRGIQLLNGYFLALQMQFFEAPVPSLVPAFAALLLARRLSALDRYLLAGCALVLLGYLSFWGEGDYLGPRYLIPLAPAVAIWTARFGRMLAQWSGRGGLRRWGNVTVGLMVISGWILGVPGRWSYYGQTDPLRRLDVRALTTPMAEDALVLVPSPWSSQVLARIRGTGLSRQRAQWFHDRIGLCRLDVALSDMKRRDISERELVEQELLPLTADSASMVRDPRTGAPGDPFTGIQRAGETAATLCRMRLSIEQTNGGYLQLPFYAALGPTWTGDGPIVARDLAEENPRLLSAFPGRNVYVLRPIRLPGRIRRFQLAPLNADSAQSVWTVLDSLAQGAEVF